MLRTIVTVVAFTGFLSGCGGVQEAVRPARFDSKDICIIENPWVRTEFLESYKRALVAKGYSVRQLAKFSSIDECPITSTYGATWIRDFVDYLFHAEIRVYNRGERIGEATYDASRARRPNYINVANKVAELV